MRNLDVVLATFRRRLWRPGKPRKPGQYTQSEIARLAGMSVQSVCDVAKGRRAPAGRLLRWLGFEQAYVRVRRPRSRRPDTSTGGPPVGTVGDSATPTPPGAGG